jgi:hypothetical protein
MRCLELANGSIQRKQKDFSSMSPPFFYYCCLWLWLLTTKQRGAVICMCTLPLLFSRLLLNIFVVCIYGAICLKNLFLNHHILLFCLEILIFFA